MAIELTEAAAAHVSRELARRGRGKGLRVSTKKSGCTGFAYVVDYADEIGAGDRTYDSHGVTDVAHLVAREHVMLRRDQSRNEPAGGNEARHAGAVGVLGGVDGHDTFGGQSQFP